MMGVVIAVDKRVLWGENLSQEPVFPVKKIVVHMIGSVYSR